MSFHVPAKDLSKHQIFHTGASSLVQRYVMEDHGMNEYGGCKLECEMGSSSDAIQVIRHPPCPLVGTCLRGSDPSDLIACKDQR